MSNFDYVSAIKGMNKLHEAAVQAEEYQVSEPRRAAEWCKQTLEEICRIAMQQLNIKCPDTTSLSAMLDTEALTLELSNMDVLRQIRQVRRRSNAAANLGDDLDGMPYVVELLYHIVGTVLMSLGYIKEIPEYVPTSGVCFDIPQEPID